jgi:tRNA U55 pseudouridine synthase TruB
LLDIHIINESEIHLKEILLDIGIRLRTSTLSESIRRTKLGPINIEHALVIDEITPTTIVDNIVMMKTLIEQTNAFDKTILVNKTHRQETKFLGKQVDQSSVDLYRTKRMIDHHQQQQQQQEWD